MNTFLEQFPQFELPNAADVTGPAELGYGVYVFTATKVTEAEYFACTARLEEAGFVQIDSHCKEEKRNFHVSTYKKENLFVAFRLVAGLKIWISFYRDENYHMHNGVKLFAGVPGYDECEAKHCGDGCYLKCVEDVSREEYEAYLCKLEYDGYIKFVENTTGLGDVVFTTTYVKNNLVLTVTYVSRRNKMYLVVGIDMPLSEHLQYHETYMNGCNKDSKTSLAMMKMFRLGCSFIIKMKNGHFIVNDGGFGCELDVLLTYLEENTQDEERPVVEAWFISHAHPDHSGVLTMIGEHPEYAERVTVEGIYYNEPSDNVITLDPANARYQIFGIKDAARVLNTKIYRPMTGQRYYFCDLTIDILHAPEQITMEEHTVDFNDSCIWCLYTIDGQTVMLAGDADRGSSKIFAETYEKGYWHFDVFASFHHGSNTDDNVTNHCSFQTILVPRTEEPENHPEENRNLKEHSKEWFLKGAGSRLLTFPYNIGMSELLMDFDERTKLL